MKKTKTDPTKTVLIITVGFVIIFLITKVQWAIFVAVGIGLIGILSSYLSKKIDFLWMKLAWILSLIIPNILLGLVFYLFLFPISLLAKLFGNKDPLILKNKTDSIYINSNKKFEKETFEKLW